MSDQYEYKIISASTTWTGRMEEEETERRLNQLSQAGWELDQTSFDWWSLSPRFVLRRLHRD
ncbi:DUF4177 domain-containing protein [Natronorubrum sp. DTA28]|uniref:DUF4177 domain-containing protein n=1 Tax=Natronorubrum sp. DTA28 TaxID=3447019 RepID=UPI003F8543EF